MCNINLIFKKNRKPLTDIERGVLNITTYNSFNYNDDGEGFFSIGQQTVYSERSENKIVFTQKQLKDSYLVVAHERLTTSGNNNLMIHPHIARKVVVLHNGIFTGLGDNNKSDTRIYTDKLNKLLNKGMNIKKAINHIHKTIKGSFSIVLYEIQTGKLYYYKNNSTNMYSYEDNNYLMMSTKKDNIKISLQLLEIDSKKIKEVKNNVLFDLLSKNTIRKGKQLRVEQESTHWNYKDNTLEYKQMQSFDEYCVEEYNKQQEGMEGLKAI